ncbi:MULTISPECIES: NAD(P)-dependent oxidoreductase [Solibacillus]|uniref:NAD(P)-dependent oxidoreductase n=1 Tax=Solibacillus TaxID=648800 RepID=UPI00203F0AA7|nr:NAD(P)H-binding protein [Solibacillus isronensis]MCM3723768.1 NAD(P)H-binding protein [Solibacillus isronensis]
MKIAVIGAAGKAGTHILREAIMRNFDVTAIVKNKATVQEENINIIESDLFNLTKEQIAPFDILINAFAPLPGEEHLHVDAGEHLISLLEGTEKKLFVIGSSGCLFVDREKTVRLMDLEDYPEDLAIAAKAQLQNLRDLESSSIQWSFAIPSAMFDSDGPRTGHYIKGEEKILVNSQFNSYISYADFAVALLDEIEKNEYPNTTFTVASENVTAAS